MGKQREKGTERDFAWGGRGIMQCADDVLLVAHLKAVSFCKTMSPQ